MDDDEVFAACTALRRELADLLASLSPTQWEAPSLCAGWTVRVVVGHLLAALTGSLGEFAIAVLRHFGNAHAANDAIAKRFAERSPDELIVALREHAERRLRQPVIGTLGPLTDLLVHGGDIRIPLGLPFDPPMPETVAALDFLTGRAPGFVPRGRLEGLTFEASDVDRTWGAADGTGQRIGGRAVDLMMAICGRRAVFDSLAGPGRDVLLRRIS